MLMGSGFPDESVSARGMQNAALSKNGETLVIVSLQDTLASPAVSAQKRRLFGPCGYASRHDVLVAAGMNASPGEEIDFEAWVAYRKAKKKGGEKKREEGDSRQTENKEIGGGRTLNCSNRSAEIRNRCFKFGQKDAPRSESAPSHRLRVKFLDLPKSLYGWNPELRDAGTPEETEA